MEGDRVKKWEIVGGPREIVAARNPRESRAWGWELRNLTSGEVNEVEVRVTWKGYESIGEIPSELTKEAERLKGLPGAEILLDHEHVFEGLQVIYHAQTRTPHMGF